MSNYLFASEIMKVVEKSLDAATLQHAVISNNVANVNTPYFKRSEVTFRDELASVLTRRVAAYAPDMSLAVTHGRHIQTEFQSPVAPSVDSVQAKVLVRQDTSLRNDGNNVDVDVEMTKLAENALLYNAFAQIAAMKMTGIRSAINEGRR